MEAVKVRMQGGSPNPYTGAIDGFTKITAKEGYAGLYKGLYPLWGRQIPYTMMKFASFETIVEMIYDRLPGEKSEYSKAAQTGVSFTGGYLAGILCAIVSHPADVMVSKLNSVREPGEAFGSAMGRIYKDIGFTGLWNGLPMRIVMIGTLTGLQWMIYVGLSSRKRRDICRRCTDLATGLLQDLHGLAHHWWPRSAAGEEIEDRETEMLVDGYVVLCGLAMVYYWNELEYIDQFILLFGKVTALSLQSKAVQTLRYKSSYKLARTPEKATDSILMLGS